MPSHKTDWGGLACPVAKAGVEGRDGCVGNVVCSEQLGQCQVIGFGLLVWEKHSHQTGNGIHLPQGVPGTWIGVEAGMGAAARQGGSGSPGAAAGKALLPSLTNPRGNLSHGKASRVNTA